MAHYLKANGEEIRCPTENVVPLVAVSVCPAVSGGPQEEEQQGGVAGGNPEQEEGPDNDNLDTDDFEPTEAEDDSSEAEKSEAEAAYATPPIISVEGNLEHPEGDNRMVKRKKSGQSNIALLARLTICSLTFRKIRSVKSVN